MFQIEDDPDRMAARLRARATGAADFWVAALLLFVVAMNSWGSNK